MSKVTQLLRNIFASVEALSTASEALDGVVAVEREKVFYARIADFKELETADSYEDQEQWEIRPKETGAGVVRVRRTATSTDRTYIYSLATKVFDGDTRQETEVEISEDLFNGFRAIAPGGMIKRRYMWAIPNTDMKWEVDVYFDGDEFAPWCKIDLECDDLNAENPPFPIALSEVISGNRAVITQAQRDQLDVLFKTVFITPNPRVKST